MPEAIRIIHDEHRALAAVLQGLLHLVTEIDEGRMQPDFRVLAAMLHYIDAFPEKLHHPKEDEFLYRLLRARLAEPLPLLDELEAEHVRGRTLIEACAPRSTASRRKAARRSRRSATRRGPTPSSTGPTCARRRTRSCRSPRARSPTTTGRRSTQRSRRTRTRSWGRPRAASSGRCSGGSCTSHRHRSGWALRPDSARTRDVCGCAAHHVTVVTGTITTSPNRWKNASAMRRATPSTRRAPICAMRPPTTALAS